MGDSGNIKNQGFNLQNELSSLVQKNVLPKKIADRLGKKLMEKNVNLTKQQFYFLINKLTGVLKNTKYGQNLNPLNTEYKVENNDMKKLIDTIENLEKRILDLETGQFSNENFQIPGMKNPKIVKTNDIRVSDKINIHKSTDWEMEPLKEIPNDPEGIIVLMKWIQYLIDRCGRDNLSNILDYYVDIGWITQDAKISLLDYSHGIKEEKTKDNTINNNISNLPSKDHIQSLIYIQKLKGNQIDNHFIERIDSELNRITKKLDYYKSK